MEISLDRVGGARAVLLAGPTASGKSAAALRLAEQAAAQGRRALIVNADSMQVYDGLRVLTARPVPADEARAPHRLYGHVPAAERYSVGAWLNDVEAVLLEAEPVDALPIVVGGTGLYFKALTEGLVAMPAIPRDVRAYWSERLAAEGTAKLHAELVRRDAAAALSVRPSDAQRVVRALEVLEATGRPLGEWQQAAQAPPLLPESEAARFVLEPGRAALYQRIDQRFDRMVGDGALQEVEDLLRQDLDPRMPVMKATGVRELAAVLRDGISLSEASAQAKMETRRYAKRQLTWLRHQMRDWPRVTA